LFLFFVTEWKFKKPIASGNRFLIAMEKTISGLRLPKGRFFQRDQKMNVGRVGKIDFFGLDCQKNDSPNAARNGFRSRRENLFFW